MSRLRGKTQSNTIMLKGANLVVAQCEAFILKQSSSAFNLTFLANSSEFIDYDNNNLIKNELFPYTKDWFFSGLSPDQSKHLDLKSS